MFVSDLDDTQNLKSLWPKDSTHEIWVESETKIFSTFFRKFKLFIFNDSKSSLKSNVTFWIQFYINFMIFFLNFWDLQPISMWGFCLACLRSYPILAIFGPKRPSAASWAGLGCLKNNFPYYFNTTLAFGRCRQDCEKKVGPISLQWQSPWLLRIREKILILKSTMSAALK